MSFRCVILESPFASAISRFSGKIIRGPEQRHYNKLYLAVCMRDCLLRGEAPFASHGLYTQDGVLNDDAPEERAIGINAGFAWHRAADATVVYQDRGITEGMLAGIENAKKLGIVIEYRNLPSYSTFGWMR